LGHGGKSRSDNQVGRRLSALTLRRALIDGSSSN
jgi:hypothetical protein